MRRLIHRARWGVLFNWRAAWIGAHRSEHNRRTCVNVLPCVTVWFIENGGTRP